MRFIKPLFLIALLLSISACGIKPKHLTPPSADEKGNPAVVYPRPYPDPTL